MRAAIALLLLAAAALPIIYRVSQTTSQEQLHTLISEHTLNIAGKLLAEAPHELDEQMLAQQIADRLDGGLIDTVAFYTASGDLIFETPFNQSFTMDERVFAEHIGEASKNAPFRSLRDGQGTEALLSITPVRRSLEQPPLFFIASIRRLHTWEKSAPLRTVGVILAMLATGAAITMGFFSRALRNRDETLRLLETSSQSSRLATVLSLSEAIARRDDYTGRHVTRVALIAVAIGEAMNCRRSEIRALICGSMLHDIGKVGVVDSILNKPGKLEEWEIKEVRSHPTHGANIVSSLEWLADAKQIILFHHEKWDGSGYPFNLSGTSIPPLARIVAVADVFDALCSERGYKTAWSIKDGLTYIDRAAGTHFDPVVVTAFINAFSRVKSEFLLATPSFMNDRLKLKMNEYFSLHPRRP